MSADRYRLLSRMLAGIIETGRATRSVIEAPPYIGFVDTECPVPWMSCAFPVSPIEEPRTAYDAIETLRRSFRAADRSVRFEIFDGYPHGHASVLDACGFIGESSDPLLGLESGDFHPVETPREDGIDVRIVTEGSDSDLLRGYVRAARAAFGHVGNVSVEAEAEALSRDLDRRRVACAYLRVDEEIVSVATLVGVGSSTELAGVGTVPRYRRRGFGAYVSSVAVAGFFDGFSGAAEPIVWLSAGGEEAERIYRRIGFRRIGAYQINFEDHEQKQASYRPVARLRAQKT